MGIGALNYQGVKGGVKLNDVIEEFKYVYQGQTIKAGDFVEYINGVAGQTNYGTSSDTALNGTDAETGEAISAVELDGGRVFVAHSSSRYLYGIVCTINGATITKGTDTQLNTTDYSGTVISTELLPNGNVFIAYNHGSNDYLAAVVCTVSGTTITKGQNQTLKTSSYAGYAISTELLPNGDVFIAHTYNYDTEILYGMVVTVSGTTISAGTDTKISSTFGSGSIIHAKLLPNGKIFIAHSYGSSSATLYGTIVTVSGTTISIETSTKLSSTTAIKNIQAEVLSENSVFVVYSYNSNYQPMGIVCTINGTTITSGTDTILYETLQSGRGLSTLLLPSGKILIVHATDSPYGLSAVIVTVSGTTITLGVETLLNSVEHAGYVTSSIFLNNGTLFIAHSHTSGKDYLYAQIFGIDETNNIPTNQIIATEYEQQVTPATQPPFDGIALSSGVGGDDTAHNEQVKIARPNV